ncbi:MAG: chitobiase/beta-hexosaminidase C-terminal domain-containing protein [Verrucomicrobiae bacterium]|nr:chitobiase/beta-hexosaminidase C-terminal domain-containing protein [Verrucomicrobiae bacterium]
MQIEDILDLLPAELKARLDSDPFFDDIPVVLAVKGNVAQEYSRLRADIEAASGHRGVVVIVQQIIADDIYLGLPGGPMKLFPSFQVIENVELNNDDSGTKKSARKVARHIIKNMKLAGFRDFVQGMKCATPAIHPADIKDLADNVVAEQVNFECQEFSDEQFLYCLPPVFTQVPGQAQIQITTATPGAAVWYTTDDTFPYPGTKDDGYEGSTSQLYAAPLAFTLNVPQTIRAAAYGPSGTDYISSSIERAVITLTSL